MKNLFILALLSTLCTPALSAEGRWSEGYGQGNLEYFIEKQGFTLSIGCPTQDGSADAPSSVSLYRTRDISAVSKFTVTINGATYDGPLHTNSRVGGNNFIAFLEDARKGDAVVKFGEKTLVFPKSNAAKVLPVFGKKGFACNLFF